VKPPNIGVLTVSFKKPKNAWESDPFFGSILMIVMGAAIPFPMAIFSWTFGEHAAPWIFLTGCVLFWSFEIWTAFKPFNLD
jgi:hypothetical protein